MISSSTTLGPTASTKAGTPVDAGARKITRAARQFEAQLLTSVLTSLEKTMGTVPGAEESGASEQYRSLAVENLASAWADRGGIGLGRMVEQALTRAAASEAGPVEGQVKEPINEQATSGVTSVRLRTFQEMTQRMIQGKEVKLPGEMPILEMSQ